MRDVVLSLAKGKPTKNRTVPKRARYVKFASTLPKATVFGTPAKKVKLEPKKFLRTSEMSFGVDVTNSTMKALSGRGLLPGSKRRRNNLSPVSPRRELWAAGGRRTAKRRLAVWKSPDPVASTSALSPGKIASAAVAPGGGIAFAMVTPAQHRSIAAPLLKGKDVAALSRRSSSDVDEGAAEQVEAYQFSPDVDIKARLAKVSAEGWAMEGAKRSGSVAAPSSRVDLETEALCAAAEYALLDQLPLRQLPSSASPLPQELSVCEALAPSPVPGPGFRFYSPVRLEPESECADEQSSLLMDSISTESLSFVDFDSLEFDESSTLLRSGPSAWSSDEE